VKLAAFSGGLLGLALLIGVAIHSDLGAMARALALGGGGLLWLVPYHLIFLSLYALGWQILLVPGSAQSQPRFVYLLWASAVREAIDRLLPVASVGGSLVGVRLVGWRGVPVAAGGASVLVEMVVTLVASYLFTAAGVVLLLQVSNASAIYRPLGWVLLLSAPVPIVTLLLLRHGSVFQRLQKLGRRLVGQAITRENAESLDRQLRLLLTNGRLLLTVGSLQLLALVSGSFEVWFALRLFGHPVGVDIAILVESMTLAVRHLAFFVPAGIGVQEVGLVLLGHVLGIDGELALALSMAKRVRELLWGVPSLLSWQWMEGKSFIKSV
jgi:putative membrane protein